MQITLYQININLKNSRTKHIATTTTKIVNSTEHLSKFQMLKAKKENKNDVHRFNDFSDS